MAAKHRLPVDHPRYRAIALFLALGCAMALSATIGTLTIAVPTGEIPPPRYIEMSIPSRSPTP